MDSGKTKEVRAKRRCAWWPQWLTWVLIGLAYAVGGLIVMAIIAATAIQLLMLAMKLTIAGQVAGAFLSR
jgi:hypothetical protein